MDEFVISEYIVQPEAQTVERESIAEYPDEFLWPGSSEHLTGEYPVDEADLEPENSEEEMLTGNTGDDDQDVEFPERTNSDEEMVTEITGDTGDDDQDLLTPSHEIQASEYYNQDPQPKSSAPREKRQRVKTGIIYECDVCEKKFQYESSLQIHKRFHSGEKLSQCNECGKRFATQYALKRHSRTHEQTQASVCETCNASFMDPGDFARHTRFHETGEAPYTCKHCGDTFDTYSAIKAHRSRKHRSQWQCKHCWESFPTEKLYREHRVTHETYSCSQCNMKFMTQEMLEMHEEEAGEHRPPPNLLQVQSNSAVDAAMLECDLCSKSFTRRDSLLEHRRLHTGVGLVSCDHCPMKFTSHARLRKHMARHSLQRNFQCSQCEKAFATERYLKIHQLTHTGDQLPFKCEMCGKEFLRSNALRNHMFSHLKRFPCGKCQLIFPSDRQLKKHRKTHKLICSRCGMNFETLELLQMHYIEYHPNCPEAMGEVPGEEKQHELDPLYGEPSDFEKKYEGLLLYRCEICDKTFMENRYLRDHMFSHMKRFPCNRCNEVFSSERLLKKHRKTHKFICRECKVRCESAEGFRQHYRDLHPDCEVPEVEQTVEKKDLNTSVEENPDYEGSEVEETVERKVKTEYTSVEQTPVDENPLDIKALVFKEPKEPRILRCETCGKEFSRLSYLKMHINTHTKSFPCSKCFMVFTSERRLKRHRKSHILFCKICNTRFDSGELLHEHYKEEHPDRKLPKIPKVEVEEPVEQVKESFPCQYCDEQFPERSLRDNHVEAHLANKFRCSMCPEFFDKEKQLRKHIKAHRKTCRFCTRKFKTPERLQDHYKELHSDQLHLLEVNPNSQEIQHNAMEVQTNAPIEEVFTQEPQIEERYPIEEIFTVEDSMDGVIPEVVILEDD